MIFNNGLQRTMGDELAFQSAPFGPDNALGTSAPAMAPAPSYAEYEGSAVNPYSAVAMIKAAQAAAGQKYAQYDTGGGGGGAPAPTRKTATRTQTATQPAAGLSREVMIGGGVVGVLLLAGLAYYFTR